MTVIAMWLLSIVGTTLFFVSYFITLWYCNIIILSCLVTSIYAYTMIFRFLRCHAYKGQKTVYQGQPNQNLQLRNLAKYKKSVKNALWVQLTLVVCYLPYVVEQALPVSISCKGVSVDFSLSKFVTESNYLLLEDRRSKASGERNS